MAGEAKTGETAAAEAGPPNRLHAELAARILRRLKDQGVGPGYHLVEQALCEAFAVSHTPIRGALKLLAEQGHLEARPHRGFVLVEPITAAPVPEPVNPQAAADHALMTAIARARNAGELADDCSQLEIMRRFQAHSATVVRVLHRLADLRLVERRAGNGWSFVPLLDSLRAQAESYEFRSAVEPAVALQETFALDQAWARATRERHTAFRRRAWDAFSPVEFYEMNSDFHEQLARCSGNRYLLEEVRRQIQLRTFLNYHWSYGHDRVLQSIDEHLAILDAFEADDRARAAALMLEHLKESSRHTTAGPSDLASAGT